MKKKITVIGAFSLAGIMVALSIFGNGSVNEGKETGTTLAVENEVEPEVQTPALFP